MVGFRIAVAAMALLLLGARQSPEVDPVQPAGEGTICAWAILSYVSEAAERCRPDADPEVKAALRRAVSRLDDYMRANGHLSDAEIIAFKADQGHVGAPGALICSADKDTMGMVDASLAMPASEIERWSTEITARPGTPSWGTCL